MSQFSYLQIRNPKDDETPVEAATQIFSSLLPSHFPLWKRIYLVPKVYSFEIYYISQMIYYYVATPNENEQFMKSLISSAYPQSKIQKTTDPMDIMMKAKNMEVGELVLNSYYYYPIKTYADFKIDPIASLIGFLSKQDGQLKMAMQITVTPAGFPWQADSLRATTKTVSATGVATSSGPDANKSLIAKKAGFMGGKAAIRLMVSTANQAIPVLPYLQNLAGTFGSFSMAEGNQFSFKKPLLQKERLIKKMRTREFGYFERSKQILNSQELATLWHPPGMQLAGIKSIAWGKTLKGEPPENLPVTTPEMSEEQKKDINFFAKTDFKNKESIFGITTRDRGKHIYIMGKTGTGKSTLIANMAIDDIRKDRGIGIIDPHGDLCEIVVDFIPKRRLNDVVYLEPFDVARPFSLNVLEVREAHHKHLVASGIVSIFSKLYANSWGPRLEYVLRNVVLTLLEIPGSTLADVLPLLAHDKFRAKAIEKIQDPVIKDFWVKEFDIMPPKMKAEVVSPIQNKVGQFVTTKMIRNIIGHPTSSVSIEQIMDEGKILLLNLSQGKLGEDNASLLGAMIITQIQLAAMRRAFIKEEDRRPFFLYVDEFQNFATSSFLKILSEARKYKLSLTLANQYIDQLEEEIQRAIFGNVGTLAAFVVGARDATVLSKEFAGLYSDNDLVSLGKHEIIVKLSIDFFTSSPFPAKTLPLPSLKNDNREKIVRLSKEKYGRKVKDDTPTPVENTEPEHPYEEEKKKGQAPQPKVPQQPKKLSDADALKKAEEELKAAISGEKKPKDAHFTPLPKTHTPLPPAGGDNPPQRAHQQQSNKPRNPQGPKPQGSNQQPRQGGQQGGDHNKGPRPPKQSQQQPQKQHNSPPVQQAKPAEAPQQKPSVPTIQGTIRPADKN